MQIEQYMQELGTQTRSVETLRAYRQDLERFELFLKSKGLQVNEVRSSTAAEYVAYLEATSGRTATAGRLSAATINRRLTVISTYYDWLQRDSDEVVRNPIKALKRPRIKNIENRDVDDGILETLVSGITSSRDRALVLLFLYTGVRLSELRMMDKTTFTVRREQVADGSFVRFGEGTVTGSVARAGLSLPAREPWTPSYRTSGTEETIRTVPFSFRLDGNGLAADRFSASSTLGAKS